MRIIISLSVFLIVFGFFGFYVYKKIIHAFSKIIKNQKLVFWIYFFLLFSFFLGKIIETFSINIISISLIKIGSLTISYFLYTLIIIIFFDIIRLINFIIPFYPKFIKANYQKTKLIIGIISFIIVTAIFSYGYINTLTPKVKKLDISINKNKLGFDSLNVVAISDIHLGTIVNETKTKKLIKKINEIKPDLVIFGGDIIDDNPKVVKYFGLLKHFKNIKSKYGVYSCMGNHEYISKSNKDIEYYEKNNIHMLIDSTVKIQEKFYIISRDDIAGEQISGKKRKTLKDLTKNIDFKLPVILLDHQPYNLDKTAEYPIDLQFSGHTHNGQVWPFNYITELIFEKAWGYLKKKNTHFYISSGYGTAVVPIRTAGNSEIVNIKIINK